MKYLYPILNTLRARLFVALLVVGVLPLGLVGVFLINLETRALTDQSTRELTEVARGLADELDTYVVELLQDSRIIATIPDIASMDTARQEPLLQDLFEFYDRYGQLASVDLNGQILVTGNPMELTTINHIESFRIASTRGEQAWVVAPHLSIPDVLVLHMHTPIRNQNNEVIGVLGSPTSLATLTQVLDDLRIGEGEAFVLDETGRVLLHPDPEKGDARRDYSEFITLPNAENNILGGTATYTIDGQRKIAGYAAVSNFGWTVVLERPESGVLAPAIRARNIALLGLVATILLSFTVARYLSRIMTKQTDRIQTLFEQIRQGNYEARVEIISEDEFGRMAEDLNYMLDNTMVLVQSQEERNSLQESIVKLLDEVADVAEGDLTVEAEVTGEATGAIADSFNYMIGQLRQIISGVQDTSNRVTASAQVIRNTAEQLAEGSESQASQIVRASSEIEAMATSMQEVSRQAARSVTVAQEARNSALRGTMAVEDTLKGMNRIRSQVHEAADRIIRLGQSSEQIGEIVKVISNIADRTSILALNASIQAAGAGPAGRGFAIVAQQVEGLSAQAAEATQQITTLIKTVQNEITEAVGAMEESSREVELGSGLADQASHALTEIEQVSDALSELIQTISQSAENQARRTETVAASMGEIAQVTRMTADGTRNAALSISDLSRIADDLRNSVSTFKLPRTNGKIS